jgi:peptidoglycan/LPS O-acetylase OafA/YrhL
MALAKPAPGPSDLPAAAIATAPDDAPAESRQREISGGVHFPALDGYRAIAALMVLLTHVASSTGEVVQGTLGHVLGRFDFGVPLFFLMSGFLLYRPWVRAALEGRPRPDIRRYSLRRAARILPLYWLVVVVTLLVLPEIQPVPRDQWLVHLLGLQIYQSQLSVEGLGQTWSLCTEISFYVALPFLGMLALGRGSRSVDDAWRRQVRLLAVLVVVANVWMAVRLVTDALPFQAAFWLPAYLDWFAGGMALALVEVRARQPHPPRVVTQVAGLAREPLTCLVLAISTFAIVLTPVGGAYAFGIGVTGPWDTVAKHWLYLTTAFFLLLPGLLGDGRGWPRQLTRRVPQRLGLISYGIFLWHLMLLRLLMPALGIPYWTGRTLLVAVVLTIVTVGVASITYRLVERPAQEWAHRF